MRVNQVKVPIVLDTDIIECFASLDDGISILVDSLGTEIYVTGQLIEEIDLLYGWPSKSYIAERVNAAVGKGKIGRMSIEAISEDARLFIKMTSGECPGLPVIGKGEAAALLLAKASSGTIASNNLRDVKRYCVNNGIPLLCTEDVLSLAVVKNRITMDYAAVAWDKLKADGHFLPPYDFSEAHSRFIDGSPL